MSCRRSCVTAASQEESPLTFPLVRAQPCTTQSNLGWLEIRKLSSMQGCLHLRLPAVQAGKHHRVHATSDRGFRSRLRERLPARRPIVPSTEFPPNPGKTRNFVICKSSQVHFFRLKKSNSFLVCACTKQSWHCSGQQDNHPKQGAWQHFN